MSSQPRNDDASDIPEASQEEEELLKLEEEVVQMAQQVLEYRTKLPGHLSSTLSSLLASRRPVLPTHLVEEAEPDTRMLPGSDSEAGASHGPTRETTALPAPGDPEEAEKVQLLKQKILSNASALPVVMNRMKEYMDRVDKLESADVIIHPAFKRKLTS